MRAGTGRTGLPAGFELLLLASLVLVTVFLVYPLGVAVFRTLGEAPAGASAIAKSIESGALLRVLRNTALVVFGGAALATVVGAVLAFINERTDGSLGASGELLPLAPMIVPPIAGVWVDEGADVYAAPPGPPTPRATYGLCDGSGWVRILAGDARVTHGHADEHGRPRRLLVGCARNCAKSCALSLS